MSQGSEDRSERTRVWTPELAADVARSVPVPERLGPYRIEGQIGSGGMGVVYAGLDTRLDRRVAIKMLPDDVAHDARALSYLENEARLLASLNHPNIATIYSLENIDGFRFFTLELIEGETLAALISEGGPSLGKRLNLFRQIAEALEFAHENGVIHCDLKPANVLVGPRENAKVLDFGLARLLRSAPTDSRRREVTGTPGYMSPEQVAGRVPDKRSDVWAFGCLLAEAVSGRKAFAGETVDQVFEATVRGEPDLGGIPDNLPEPLRALIPRCLEKDPDGRLPDLSGVADTIFVGASSLRWLDAGEPVSGVLARTLAQGDEAVPFELRATSGERVSLASLLAKGPVMVSFYRGKWCPVCTAELAYFQQRSEELAALGASLVAISPQIDEHNQSLRQEQGLTFELLSDPGNRVARAYGVAFGLPEDLKVFHRSLGLDLKEFNGDDSWVLPIPATFVVRRDGKIHYAVTSPDPTVRPNMDGALAALRELGA